jgi:threonine/homoserine/homoserine lactone efflux protein
MCVLAWSSFAPDLGNFSVQLPVVILTFAICQLCLHSLWCWLGTIMGKSLRNNVPLTRAIIVSTVIIVLIAVLL